MDQLAAVLIVRDEASALPGCLQSLAGVVDVVHVHDTGSADDTPSIAAGLGAVVTRGPWTDDFSAARNDAQAGWEARWVLSIDADQRYAGDPAALRELISSSHADVLRVTIDNTHDTLPYTHAEGRLYRPRAVRWRGRVHERVVGDDLTVAAAPRAAISLVHLGYGTPELRTGKALRNAALARQALQELDDPEESARTVLDLGRSLIAAGQRQDAADTFEVLRALFPGTPQWLEGTDFLARLVLAAGLDEACLMLVAQLREAGAASMYCDWLAAQALAQLGDTATAARLLDGVSEVVDTAGRRPDPRALTELRGLLAALV